MATFAFYKINRLVLITEVESVSCMVHTKSYVKQICFIFKGLIIKIDWPYIMYKVFCFLLLYGGGLDYLFILYTFPSYQCIYKVFSL